MNSYVVQKKRSSLVMLLAILILLAGCNMKSSSVAPEISDDLPPIGTNVRDFDDIVLPDDMEMQSKNMAIRSDTFRGGVYYFKGKAEVASLKDFVRISMKNNRWKLDGESQMKKETLMAFTKANKTCMFIITDARFSTTVQMMIGVDTAPTNKLNPFGEPEN